MYKVETIVVVDFEVSEVYHINLLPNCSKFCICVWICMYNVGHDSVLKWHGSSKWSKCGDVWYYATLKVCHDKCKIQTLAGPGAHFIQETCPGHIAKNKQQGDTCQPTIQGGSVVSSDTWARVPRADFVILKTYDFDHAQMVSIVFGLDWIGFEFIFSFLDIYIWRHKATTADIIKVRPEICNVKLTTLFIYIWQFKYI